MITAKEYLQQVRTKDMILENLRKEKNSIKEMMYSIGGGGMGGERVQTSRNNDRIGTLYGYLDEKEKELDLKIIELLELKMKVTEEINGLDDSRYINLLYMRYIRFCTWTEIAVDMQCTDRHVLKLHKQALAAFEKKYNTMLQEMEIVKNGD